MPTLSSQPENQLDNDKKEQTVADIFKLRNPTGYSLGHFDKHIEDIDQYTQSKLKAFAGEVEEAIGSIEPGYDTENPWEADQRAGRNKFRVELNKALKAIKEKYINPQKEVK